MPGRRRRAAHPPDGPGGAAPPRAARCRWSARCSRRRARRASRCPRSWPWASRDDLGADWLVVERLEGETIPRKILRDAEWAGPRRAAHRAVRPARWPPSTPSTPTPIDGLPPADPLGDPLPYPRPARARCAPRSSSACAGWSAHRPAGRAPGDGARRLPPGQLPRRRPTACAACSTGSWPTPATRPRTSGGCARRPGASAAAARWAGFGALDELLDAYAAAGGGRVDARPGALVAGATPR